jgi:thioredoxin 1
MVQAVTTQNFEQEVIKSGLPVVVDVHASWCGPCRTMMPFFEELAIEYSGKYKFTKLNIDEERDLAIQYRVSSIPTFLFFKDGKVIGKETGAMSKDGLYTKIVSYLGS